jgi:hypothetical protein
MSPYSLTKLPDESIVVCTFAPASQVANHLQPLVAELNDMLHRIKHPVYLVLDLSATHFEMHDIVVLANEAARGDGAFAHHTNLRGFMLVSDDPVIGLAAQGMRTQTFGFAPVSAYDCMDEALDAARALLIEGNQTYGPV